MNKIAFSLLFVCFIGGSAFWLLPNKYIPSTECANEFSSSYYKNYHNQLLAFLHFNPLVDKIKNAPSTPFNNQLQKLISIIDQPMGDTLQQRHYHENFVHQLRDTLALLPATAITEEENGRLFCKDLIHWIFLEADLRQSTFDYFYNLTPKPQANGLAALIPILNTLRAEKKSSHPGHKHTPSTDSFLQGNLPYRLFTLSNSSATAVFRMAYPLNDLNKLHLPWITPSPHPEFLAFVKNQPGHLYVNLMKRKGSESSATYALEQLEINHPNLFVVTLDRNSNFYWQDPRTYPEIQSSTEFKASFLNQLLNKKGHFYWSASLDLAHWKNELKSILDEIMLVHFRAQPFLNRSERLDYIELSYLAILDKLAEQLKPASMNITCRQCMDRGPALYVLWMLQKNQVTEKESIALLLAPPLLIHNRPSHLSRIERFISAAKKVTAKETPEK